MAKRKPGKDEAAPPGENKLPVHIDFQHDILPNSVRDLIETSLNIENQDARAAGTIGYMTRGLTVATMPHRDPKKPYFERVNGKFTLSMMARPSIGLPYGSLPRLLISWVTTEAVRTKNRELVLGDSLSKFLETLDLNRSGGQRGDITRLRQQMKRLFSCMISAEFTGKNHFVLDNVTLVDRAVVFWDPQDENAAGLWNSSIILSERFFQECVDHPVPVDMRAFGALKRSPLAIDIYCWLTYRFSYLRNRTLIPWELLKGQFGADYREGQQGLLDFKRAYLRELNRVIELYPDARVDTNKNGLILQPSLTSVRPVGAIKQGSLF